MPPVTAASTLLRELLANGDVPSPGPSQGTRLTEWLMMSTSCSTIQSTVFFRSPKEMGLDM